MTRIMGQGDLTELHYNLSMLAGKHDESGEETEHADTKQVEEESMEEGLTNNPAVAMASGETSDTELDQPSASSSVSHKESYKQMEKELPTTCTKLVMQYAHLHQVCTFTFKERKFSLRCDEGKSGHLSLQELYN